MKVISIEKSISHLILNISQDKLSKELKEDLKFTAFDYDCKISFGLGLICFGGGSIELAYKMCLILATELPTEHQKVKEDNARAYHEYRVEHQKAYNNALKNSLK